MFNDTLLVLYAVALQFVSVLFAKSNIEGYVPLNNRNIIFLSLVVSHKGHGNSFLLKPLIFAKQYLQYYYSKYRESRQKFAFFNICEDTIEIMQDVRVGPLSA